MSVERFSTFAHSLWRALQLQGRIRAQHELRELASRYEASQPELARQLLAASHHDARG
jgi:hypothetical protein